MVLCSVAVFFLVRYVIRRTEIFFVIYITYTNRQNAHPHQTMSGWRVMDI